jgi:ribose transport system permease protein
MSQGATAGPPVRTRADGINAGMLGALRRSGRWTRSGVLAALATICVFLTITTEQFWSTNNLLVVTRQASYVGILAVGMVFVIAMGDIDLSVGSTLMLASVCMAYLIRDGQNIWLATLVALAVGSLCGLANGVLSVGLRIPTIIVTLGTLSAYKGLGLVVSEGAPVAIERDDRQGWFFQEIGGKLGGVWTSVWVMILVAIAGWILFNRAAFGRRVQAIGSNIQAARFSGIRIARYRILVMTLMGLIAGIAAVVVLAFNQNGNPQTGIGIELKVIAATIIGGTALTGGSGSVLGAIIGALIVWLIQNGLTLLHVDPNWFDVATGAVIIAAVTLDYLIKRR